MYNQNVKFLNKIGTSSATGQNFQSRLENITAKIESHVLGQYFDNLGELHAYKKYKDGDARFKDYEKLQIIIK